MDFETLKAEVSIGPAPFAGQDSGIEPRKTRKTRKREEGEEPRKARKTRKREEGERNHGRHGKANLSDLKEDLEVNG